MNSSPLNNLAGLIYAMALKDRIQELLDAGFKRAALAKAAGKSPAAVTHWLNGETKEIKADSAAGLQVLTGFNSVWISEGKGPKKAMIQQVGSGAIVVSQSVNNEKSNVSEIPRRAKVPLISLIQAGELSDVEDLFHPGMATHWVEPRYTTPSDACYALMVEGDSMESPLLGALTFPEGTIVIVDPNGAASPNSYVIAKDVATQKATFKKLVTDGVRWFLKPLNPAYATVEIDDPAMRVIGKVIEHQPPGGKL